MKKIKVDLKENAYDVLIRTGLVNTIESEVRKRNLPEKFFVIVDKNVKKNYPKLLRQIDADTKNTYTLNAYEKNKSYDTLQAIHKKMIGANLSRNSTILAIGGGITGDVGGFAASTYMRGIKYIQVPTTLLAAVDSSVGGKTGINFNETKNIIGSFYQPDLVLIDTNFFNTLPKEEILCGIGELVKYAFITSTKFSRWLIKNIDNIFALDERSVVKAIAESVRYKGDVVISDEKESGLRKVLNFGHTFAHAIEVEQDHKIKHGQAVVVGIACALYLSHRTHLIPEAKLNKFLKIIEPFKELIAIRTYDKNKLYSIMGRDKKNVSGKIKFVLIKDIGEIVLDYEASKKDVLYSLDKGLSLFAG